ncbi:MAG: hypothetical protein IPK46_19045 [Saprospiraceae bacterium]|nr:hypothetical protein [Saprospiraceae bacterium]
MTPSPRTAGLHQYKLTNHLGNVSVIVSDNKLLSANQSQKLYLPDVLEYQDYYPFGMVMNERKGSYTDRDYRYGYNGKENDNEVKGESNQQDYGFRVYDPRVGRFLSVDPLTQSYPFYSLYQFAGNMPIWAGDVDGREPNLEHCEDGINSYYSVNPRDISIDRTSPVNFGKGGFVFFRYHWVVKV